MPKRFIAARRFCIMGNDALRQSGSSVVADREEKVQALEGQAERKLMTPRVSFGMPVYNGERFVSEALDSLLAQTYQNFEIVIADNASTDRTEEICRAYEARDPRVRYFRNGKNIGAAGNHNRVVELSTGEFFMWMAHDDICTALYVEKCLAVLENDPGIVLCYSKTGDIEEHGRALERDNVHRQLSVESEHLETNSPQAHLRFRDLIRLDHQCEAMYGVVRSRVLKSTPVHGNYADADRVLLAELGLYGRFYVIPEFLFLHREHAQRSVELHPTRQERTVWMDPTTAGKILLPHFRQLGELIRCLHRTRMSLKDRFACYGHLVKWTVANRKRFSSDASVALVQLIRRLRRTNRGPLTQG
jgi:glycosyltransferase involved in cell wall biosynthesis